MNCLVSLEDVDQIFGNLFEAKIDRGILDRLIDFKILPSYDFRGKKAILLEDIKSLNSVLFSSKQKNVGLISNDLFESDAIRLGSGTIIDLTRDIHDISPTFFSAVRNLISNHRRLSTGEKINPQSSSYFFGPRITTEYKRIIRYTNNQMDQNEKMDLSDISHFAKSAHYMGTKKTLSGFIAEALSSELDENSVILDLMCGSGVVSGSLNKIWNTYASDALLFCTKLAVIHGGGYNRSRAKSVISTMMPFFKENFDALKIYLSREVENEENLFCRNTDIFLLRDYRAFVDNFPTLRNQSSTLHWDPVTIIESRRLEPRSKPYCLFTTYFANIFFGLRQSMEIDSLRYAISRLTDPIDKDWALGALIATVSGVGTTYGGHFAQPLIKGSDSINHNNLGKIVEKRIQSVTHEFMVRLWNLAEYSSNNKNPIITLPGPWQNALSSLSEKIDDRKALIYLDAPYKREEYSRYYHVLETLVTYSYPSCKGIGLTPDPRERFKSEFSTKIFENIENSLADIILSVLKHDWSCAWSYSNSGSANVANVINKVFGNTRCRVTSYSCPHTHKSHGGNPHKDVTEYLIIFSR